MAPRCLPLRTLVVRFCVTLVVRFPCGILVVWCFCVILAVMGDNYGDNLVYIIDVSLSCSVVGVGSISLTDVAIVSKSMRTLEVVSGCMRTIGVAHWSLTDRTTLCMIKGPRHR